MRQSWTDERLDDFRGETARNFGLVDKRFEQVERRMEASFKEVKGEIATLRTEMNERFEGVDRRFEGLETRFDALHRMMFRFCTLAMTALIGTLATIVTQL